MACDHPSDLLHSIAYPSLGKAGVRTDRRHLPALPAQEEKHAPVPLGQQGIEEDTLFREIESGAKLGRNPLAGTGALALQCLFLLTLVVIPLFHTDPLPNREILTMLYAPPLVSATSSATRLQAPTPAHTPTSISSPSPTPNTQEVPPALVNPTEGVVGGTPDGVAERGPSGVFNEALSGTRSLPVVAKAPEPTPVKRIRVAARVVEANLIHDVAPTYPSEAGRARIQGTVVLLAVIGKDGSVQDVRVESGLPLLAQAAIDAVKQWRYRPYLVNGEPVEVDSRITINFNLAGA
jgi:protein TonB